MPPTEVEFEAIVREHGCRMLAVARRLLRNEEDARDAVQDAFLSAFKAHAQFEGKSQVSTWLHRIVLNCALMKLRQRKRKPEVAIESLLPAFLADGHAADPSVAWRAPEASPLEREETRAAVRAAIDRLPETSRNVILLRDIEGLDTEAVAELLGVTQNAVKIRLHRARQALRELIDPRLREEPR
jgi:RNA polymerase sigma-70 factor, ECF subfamily